jgi:hypothetical protein
MENDSEDEYLKKYENSLMDKINCNINLLEKNIRDSLDKHSQRSPNKTSKIAKNPKLMSPKKIETKGEMEHMNESLKNLINKLELHQNFYDDIDEFTGPSAYQFLQKNKTSTTDNRENAPLNRNLNVQAYTRHTSELEQTGQDFSPHEDFDVDSNFSLSDKNSVTRISSTEQEMYQNPKSEFIERQYQYDENKAKSFAVDFAWKKSNQLTISKVRISEQLNIFKKRVESLSKKQISAKQHKQHSVNRV